MRVIVSVRAGSGPQHREALIDLASPSPDAFGFRRRCSTLTTSASVRRHFASFDSGPITDHQQILRCSPAGRNRFLPRDPYRIATTTAVAPPPADASTLVRVRVGRIRIWAETRGSASVSHFRRSLQREHRRNMIALVVRDDRARGRPHSAVTRRSAADAAESGVAKRFFGRDAGTPERIDRQNRRGVDGADSTDRVLILRRQQRAWSRGASTDVRAGPSRR